MMLNPKRLFILTFCLSLLLSSASYGKIYSDRFVKIYARSIARNKLRGVIEGTGSVSVRKGDIHLTTNYIKYFPSTKMLVAEDQFLLDIRGYRISGSRFEYNVETDVASVSIPRINFGETFLGGSFMKIDKDKIDLLNAYFTGCNSSVSDYHVASTEIILYPKTGLIVAYWGTFWIGPIPTLPVPTFVYNAPVPKPPKSGKGAPTARPMKKKKLISRDRDVFPVPGLGYNTEDKYFLLQPFDWYYGPKGYVRTHISWSEKKNMGIATAANYILWNDRMEGEVRAGTNTGDGGYGGLTHIFSIGPRLLSKEEDQKYIYEKYFIGNKYLGELELNESYRERINIYKNEGPFNRVSFLPKVTMRANRNNFINDNFTYFSEVSWASVSEEGTGVHGSRNDVKADVTFDYDIVLGHFKAKSEGEVTGYGHEGHWNRATQDISLSQKFWDRLELGVGNTHVYLNEGSTPYEFEGYWFSPHDTLKTHAQWDFWWSSFSFDGKHDIPSGDWRSLTYGLTLGMHCYDIVMGYELHRDAQGKAWTQFTMTATLQPSRW